MPAEREIVRFLADYQAIWHAHFPALHRRAQWDMLVHLCTKGRNGAQAGELYGLAKQVFLLDDWTARERLLEIQQAGLCEFDTVDGPVTVRTTVTPTPALLDNFDHHLLAIADRLLALEPGQKSVLSPALTPAHREVILGSVTTLRYCWLAAFDRVFDAQGLAKPRRLEARRLLLAVSYWTLLLMAAEYANGLLDVARDQDGILADRMAAAVLELTEQNFQTTRDHIATLIDLGLLARQKGKALRVALSEPAVLELDRALHEAAGYLPGFARRLAAIAPDAHGGMVGVAFTDAAIADEPFEEQTVRLVAPLAGASQRAEAEARHHLVIVEPAAEARRVPIPDAGLTIGRAPPSNFLLHGPEVSRAHCRVEAHGDQITVTDLNSTNGTFLGNQRVVGSAALQHGMTLRIGAYLLEYECRDAATEPPQIASYGNVTPFRPRRPSGSGAK